MGKQSRKNRGDRLDINMMTDRLIARYGLKIIGADIPDRKEDDLDLQINTAITAYIAQRYCVRLIGGLWRQLGPERQFVLSIGPLPLAGGGWMVRWRFSDHHLPTPLEADDPEIHDEGLVLFGNEHIELLEEKLDAAFADHFAS